MRVLDLALKDVRQVLRDRRSLVFLTVMPILFTLFFGFSFNSQSKESDMRLKIGVVNHDPNGSLSKALVDLLGSSDTIRAQMIAERDAAQIDEQIVKGDLAAGLTIPPDFSTEMLNGGSPKLEVINNEETDSGQTARRGLQTAITRVMGIAETAQLSLKAYESKAGKMDAAGRAAYSQDAVSRSTQSWKETPLSIRSVSAGSHLEKSENPYNQFSPGMIVMFAIFGLTSASMIMVLERKNGAMARLLTTPMNKAELIGGHLLGMFLLFFAQQLVLVIFGQIILKVGYFRQPVATLVMIAVLSLWVAALGLLISALVKREEQVILFAMVAMFVFSALGGSWFSLEMVGKTFAAIGHFMPTAWAIDGFQNIIARNLGLESVLLPAGIILAYSAVFLGIAIWKFRFE